MNVLDQNNQALTLNRFPELVFWWFDYLEHQGKLLHPDQVRRMATTLRHVCKFGKCRLGTPLASDVKKRVCVCLDSGNFHHCTGSTCPFIKPGVGNRQQVCKLTNRAIDQVVLPDSEQIFRTFGKIHNNHPESDIVEPGDQQALEQTFGAWRAKSALAWIGELRECNDRHLLLGKGNNVPDPCEYKCVKPLPNIYTKRSLHSHLRLPHHVPRTTFEREGRESFSKSEMEQLDALTTVFNRTHLVRHSADFNVQLGGRVFSSQRASRENTTTYSNNKLFCLTASGNYEFVNCPTQKDNEPCTSAPALPTIRKKRKSPSKSSTSVTCTDIGQKAGDAVHLSPRVCHECGACLGDSNTQKCDCKDLVYLKSVLALNHRQKSPVPAFMHSLGTLKRKPMTRIGLVKFAVKPELSKDTLTGTLAPNGLFQKEELDLDMPAGLKDRRNLMSNTVSGSCHFDRCTSNKIQNPHSVADMAQRTPKNSRYENRYKLFIRRATDIFNKMSFLLTSSTRRIAYQETFDSLIKPLLVPQRSLPGVSASAPEECARPCREKIPVPLVQEFQITPCSSTPPSETELCILLHVHRLKPSRGIRHKLSLPQPAQFPNLKKGTVSEADFKLWLVARFTQETVQKISATSKLRKPKKRRKLSEMSFRQVKSFLESDFVVVDFAEFVRECCRHEILKNKAVFDKKKATGYRHLCFLINPNDELRPVESKQYLCSYFKNQGVDSKLCHVTMTCQYSHRSKRTLGKTHKAEIVVEKSISKALERVSQRSIQLWHAMQVKFGLHITTAGYTFEMHCVLCLYESIRKETQRQVAPSQCVCCIFAPIKPEQRDQAAKFVQFEPILYSLLPWRSHLYFFNINSSVIHTALKFLTGILSMLHQDTQPS